MNLPFIIEQFISVSEKYNLSGGKFQSYDLGT